MMAYRVLIPNVSKALFAARLQVIVLGAVLAIGGCAGGVQRDDNVFTRANEYFKAHNIQRTDQADPSELPVQVNYAMHRKPVLRQTLRVDFEFVPQQAGPYLGVGLRASEGLDWERGRREFSYSGVQAFEVLKHRVRVKPLEEGRFHLDLVVVMQVDGEYRAKSLQIPITLGVNQ